MRFLEEAQMKRYSIIFFVLLFGFGVGGAGAQTRQFKVCVPDYSVGVMPFFIAKQNGYLSQEQMDVEVIAGRGNLCTMGLIANSFQFTYSPSTFDATVAGDIKGKTVYVAEKFLLHRLIVAPQIKRFEDLNGKKIAHKVPLAAACLLSADANEFFDENGSFAVFSCLRILGKTFWIHVNGVELRKERMAPVEIVRRHRSPDIDPFTEPNGLFELAVRGVFDS